LIYTEEIIVDICRPEWLVGFLGKHYYYYPIVGMHYRGFSGGNFNEYSYGSIPANNPHKFQMKFDILSGRLTVSAKVARVHSLSVSVIITAF